MHNVSLQFLIIIGSKLEGITGNAIWTVLAHESDLWTSMELKLIIYGGVLIAYTMRIVKS